MGQVLFQIMNDNSIRVADYRFTPSRTYVHSRCMTVTVDDLTGRLRVIAPNLVNSGTAAHILEFHVSEIDGDSVDTNGVNISNVNPIQAAVQLQTLYKGFNSPTSGGGSSSAWELGGNSSPSDNRFGTVTANDVRILLANIVAGFLLATSEFVWGQKAIGNIANQNIGDVPLAWKRFWLNNNHANGNRLVMNSANAGVVDDVGLECQKQGTVVYRSGYWGNGVSNGYAQNYSTDIAMVIGAQNNEIRFQTGGANPINRMCVKIDGKVGIGTTNPTALLSVNGSANNLTGTWGVFSDGSVKDVIGVTRPEWDKVDALNFIDFTYLESFLGADNEYVDKTMYGLCANEVEKIEGLAHFVKDVEITEGETWAWQQLEADGEPHLVMTDAGTKRKIKTIEGLDKWLISQLVLKCRDLDTKYQDLLLRITALGGV